jgi:hypothetical protein
MGVYSISLALTYVAEYAIYFDGVDIVYTFFTFFSPGLVYAAPRLRTALLIFLPLAST